MPTLNNGFTIVSRQIKTTFAEDRFPLTEDTDNLGGFRVVDTAADLANVPLQRQKKGMQAIAADTSIVYILETVGQSPVWAEYSNPNPPTPPDATDVAFETTNVSASLQNQRLGVINNNRKVLQLQRVVAGIDSETEGTPTSPVDTVFSLLGTRQATSGQWTRMFSPFLSNLNQITDVSTSGDRSTVPRTYTLDGYGVQSINADGTGSWRLLPLIASGIQLSWQKCRLFYLQWPSGGTFQFNQWSSDGTSGPFTSVNTAGSLQLAWVDLPVTLSCTSATVQATSIAGNCVFMGVLFLQNDVTTDSFTIKISQAGSAMFNWAQLNASFQTQWFNALNIDLYILNGGTNDRVSQSASQLTTSFQAYIAPILASTSAPAILIFEPAQTSDWATTQAINYPPVYRNIAFSLNCGFYSVQDSIGDYAYISATTGYVAGTPVIHPSTQTNQCIGYELTTYLGCTIPNETKFAFTFGQNAPSDIFPNFRGLKQLSVGQNNPLAPTHLHTQTYFDSNIGAQSLSVAMATTDTTATMASISGYNSLGGVILIDSELMTYTGISGLVLTGINRAQFGTTAAIHNIGGAVQVPGFMMAKNTANTPIFMVVNGQLIVGSAVPSAFTGAEFVQIAMKSSGTAGAVAIGLNSNTTGLYTQAVNQDVSVSVGGVLSASFSKTTGLDLPVAGMGLKVAEGSNAKQGVVTLSSGTATVSNTSVSATSRIFLSPQDNNTTGSLRISTRTANTSFTITSSNGSDSGAIAYEIFEAG